MTKKIKYVAENFAENQLQGACLVIAATDDEAVNEAVSIAAKAQNIPVNVVDAPAFMYFYHGLDYRPQPSDDCGFQEGNAPVLARYIRTKIETMLPASYGRIAAIAGEFREQVKAKVCYYASAQNFLGRGAPGPNGGAGAGRARASRA